MSTAVAADPAPTCMAAAVEFCLATILDNCHTKAMFTRTSVWSYTCNSVLFDVDHGGVGGCVREPCSSAAIA